ncbi:MAG: 4'-phosphopantetheinyl transferase superfamily protein, partial [Bacteroidota bacterium]
SPVLGIDIVDLSDPKLQERNKRSLKLILCEKDQLIDHENVFWLLWAAKEAVFKCHREAFNFSPTSIPIQFYSEFDELRFSSDSFQGILIINSEYILAVCANDLDLIDHQTVTLENGANGDNMRSEIIEFFKEKELNFEMGSDELNLPILLPSNEPISISHHGKFGAFAYPKSLLNV